MACHGSFFSSYTSLVLHSALHFNEAFVFELFEFPPSLISPPGPAGSGVYKNPGHMLSPIKADVHQVRRLFCARKFTSFAHYASPPPPPPSSAAICHPPCATRHLPPDHPQPDQRSGSTGKMLTYADASSSSSPASRVGNGSHWQDQEHPQLPPVWLKFLDRLDAK